MSGIPSDAERRRIVRQAMLDAQSRWLDEANTAETLTLRTLATLFADVFRQEADAYRVEVTLQSLNETKENDVVSSNGFFAHDEYGATPAVSSEG